MSNNLILKDKSTVAIFADYPDIVGIEQLMSMLHIGKVLAYKLIRSKHIYSKKIGREYKIQKSAVINYLNDMEVLN